MCARFRQGKIFSRAVIFMCSLMMFAGGLGIMNAQPSMDWWVEVVAERTMPKAVKEARRKQAQAKVAKEDKVPKKEGEDIKENLKGKLQALFEVLPKLKIDELEKKGEEPGVEDKLGKELLVEVEKNPVEELREQNLANKEKAQAGNEEKLAITVAMAGEIIDLRNDHLVFRPVLNPEKELRLPLKQISSLSRHAPGQQPLDENDKGLEFRVSLRDGSEIPGKLVRLGDKVIVVSLAGSTTELSLPLAEVTRIERSEPVSDLAKGILPQVPGRHIASLATGEIVAGQLLPSVDSDRWLRIASPILTVEAPLSLIDLLVFPDPQSVAVDAEELLAEEIKVENDGNNGEPLPADRVLDTDMETDMETDEQPESSVRHLVSLTPAGMLWAKTIEVDGKNLLLSALGGERVVVPLERIESLSFGHEGLPATAPILVWGGYADEDDEYRKTIDAIDNRIPSRKLIRSKSQVPDGDFLRHLRRSRVLLIPEMEAFKKSALKDAMEKNGRGCPSWSEVFRDFLRRGGNIVFLSPTGEALSFFNECGLGPLRSGGSGTGWQFTAEGRKLGAKVEGAINNVNSTHYYRQAQPWEVWGAAKDGGNGAVVMGRRMERGWVMVYGADFYNTSNEYTETLVRLIQFRASG